MKNIKLKVSTKEGSKGNIILIVTFDEESTNFNKSNCTWCPTIDEINFLYKHKPLMTHSMEQE